MRNRKQKWVLQTQKQEEEDRNGTLSELGTSFGHSLGIHAVGRSYVLLSQHPTS